MTTRGETKTTADELRIGLSFNQVEHLYRSLRMALGATWTPALTMWERPSREVVLCFELAGVPADDVEVFMGEDKLIVSGHRRLPYGTTSKGRRRIHTDERPFGTFRRSVRLPSGCDVATAEAHFQDGVLEVRVDRTGAFASEIRMVAVASASG